MRFTLRDSLLVAITAAGFGFGGYRIQRFVAAKDPPRSAPLRYPAAEGRSVRDAWNQAGSRQNPPFPSGARVVYVFSSTCPICEQQRRHLGAILARFPREWVITISPEPRRLIASYWRKTGSELDPPVSVAPSWLGRLRIPGTPALLFLDRSGTVRRAWIGTTLGWDLLDLLRETRASE